jgi:hypothetical protein
VGGGYLDRPGARCGNSIAIFCCNSWQGFLRYFVCSWQLVGTQHITKALRERVTRRVFYPARRLRTVKGGEIMYDTDLSEVSDHIVGAHDHVMAGLNCELPHLRWELEQLLSRVRPQDLSGTEVAGLLGILTAAHSRIICRPASRPGLSVLWVRGEDSAPQLA